MGGGPCEAHLKLIVSHGNVQTPDDNLAAVAGDSPPPKCLLLPFRDEPGCNRT
jgi:hypothetical protein